MYICDFYKSNYFFSSSIQVSITSFVYIVQMLYEVLLLSVSATSVEIEVKNKSKTITNLSICILHIDYFRVKA